MAALRVAVILALMALASTARANPPSSEATSVEPPAEDPPEASPTDDGLSLRIAGGVLFGVGLAAIVGGTVTGLLAMDKQDESLDSGACTPSHYCTPAGIELRDEALVFAHASTGLFVAGSAAAVAGTLMYFLAPNTPLSQPILQPLLTFAPIPEGAVVQVQAAF